MKASGKPATQEPGEAHFSGHALCRGVASATRLCRAAAAGTGPMAMGGKEVSVGKERGVLEEHGSERERVALRGAGCKGGWSGQHEVACRGVGPGSACHRAAAAGRLHWPALHYITCAPQSGSAAALPWRPSCGPPGAEAWRRARACWHALPRSASGA